jgi:hypothetical protein
MFLNLKAYRGSESLSLRHTNSAAFSTICRSGCFYSRTIEYWSLRCCLADGDEAARRCDVHR